MLFLKEEHTRGVRRITYFYSILRIRLLNVSATYRFIPSVDNHLVKLKFIDVPVLLSVEPMNTVPASEVRTLVEITV